MRNPILILNFEIDVNQIEEVEVFSFKDLKQKIYKIFEDHQINDNQLKQNALYRAYACLPDSYKNTLSINDHKKMDKYRLKPKAYLDICQKQSKKKAKDKKKGAVLKNNKLKLNKPTCNILKQKKTQNIKNLKLMQSPPVYKNFFKNNDSLLTVEQNFSQVKRKLTQKKKYQNKQQFDSNSFQSNIQKNRYFKSSKKLGSNLTKQRDSFKKSFVKQTNLVGFISRNNSSTKIKKSQSQKTQFQCVGSKKKLESFKQENIYERKRYEIQQQQQIQQIKNDDEKISIKKLFEKLDSQNLGYIGASNLELKDITSKELKFLQNILIIIYKTPSRVYQFKDFSKLVEKIEINQYPIQKYSF